MRMPLLLLFFTTAAACATPAPPPPTETAPGPPAEAAAVDPLCWETEEEITLAAGGEQPGARRVVRLRFEPEAGRVVNESLRFDPNPRVSPRLFTVTWTVDSDAFTLADAEGRLTGAGTLTGEPWSWSGWSAESRLDSGIRIREQATIGADGSLTLARDVFGPDGRAVMTFHEEGRPLTAEECAARFVEARPHEPPGEPE